MDYVIHVEERKMKLWGTFPAASMRQEQQRARTGAWTLGGTATRKGVVGGGCLVRGSVWGGGRRRKIGRPDRSEGGVFIGSGGIGIIAETHTQRTHAQDKICGCVVVVSGCRCCCCSRKEGAGGACWGKKKKRRGGRRRRRGMGRAMCGCGGLLLAVGVDGWIARDGEGNICMIRLTCFVLFAFDLM